MKQLVPLSLILAAASTFAATFWANGIKYSNICRNGDVYTIYPVEMSHPVGEPCPIRERYDGPDIGFGIVSDE